MTEAAKDVFSRAEFRRRYKVWAEWEMARCYGKVSIPVKIGLIVAAKVRKSI